MFDRVRPPEADAEGTIKGYAPPGTTRPATAPATGATDATGATQDRTALAKTCTQCGAKVQELRRGRCWGCYQTWAALRPVGKGARCVICSERRSDCLRLVEMHGRSIPLCHGCAGRASRLSPLPYTISALRRALDRERRWQDRRLDDTDVRAIPRDRRRADRRQDRGPAAEGLGDFVVDVEVEDPDVIDVTAVAEVTPATPEAPATTAVVEAASVEEAAAAPAAAAMAEPAAVEAGAEL
jgi:hypothetical protein